MSFYALLFANFKYDLIGRCFLKFFGLINASLITNAHLLNVITNVHLPNIILEQSRASSGPVTG